MVKTKRNEYLNKLFCYGYEVCLAKKTSESFCRPQNLHIEVGLKNIQKSRSIALSHYFDTAQTISNNDFKLQFILTEYPDEGMFSYPLLTDYGDFITYFNDEEYSAFRDFGLDPTDKELFSEIKKRYMELGFELIPTSSPTRFNKVPISIK